MNKQKTVLDFVAKMRGLVKPGETIEHTYEMLNGMADCFEAAYKREIDALKSSAALAPSGAIGNGAKLRETLEFADKELRRATEDDRFGEDLVYLVGCMRTVAAVCRAALSAPPSNCDVGTAEEQYARFVAMCHSNVDLSGRCRESCPFRRVSAGYCDRAECYAKWAQMPYEGGAK